MVVFVGMRRGSARGVGGGGFRGGSEVAGAGVGLKESLAVKVQSNELFTRTCPPLGDGLTLQRPKISPSQRRRKIYGGHRLPQGGRVLLFVSGIVRLARGLLPNIANFGTAPAIDLSMPHRSLQIRAIFSAPSSRFKGMK